MNKISANVAPPAGPCCLVIFGASGDLTKRWSRATRLMSRTRGPSLAFVLFVAITDVLTFGVRTEVRSFLDINIRPPLRQANASVLRHGECDPERKSR